ncbi:hypothetical protein MGG_07344 [Pyricularia oryzae 70-15]|uniref:Uncharacterized protein n=1 Tax=Pyricularia oryzae (strain 70-15 / ATCC MYA-4617 / FGSC 8958) TaxID=242507 RepID=G4MVF0_PYRO7|nr:uncharacterized protein MGG_07344 [Pyricularia oryzae 70-15]EHA55776.1 hypothetical protein MGG_07344 [Pyricularia oryzae 70-15]
MVGAALQETEVHGDKIRENNDQTHEPSQPQDVSCPCSFLHDAKLDFDRVNCGAKVFNRGRECNKARYTPVKAVPIKEILATDARKQRSNRFHPGTILCFRKDRYAMAATATWAVLYLAETPWLLTDWDGKEQLQLIQRQQSPGGTFATISTLLWDPGRKQQYRKMPLPLPTWCSGSVRNGTLFALGILLIELGLNQSFEQLRDDEWYGYAVQRCLRFEFPGRDVTKSIQFDQFRHQFFFLCVVAPVQATFALLASSCSLL